MSDQILTLDQTSEFENTEFTFSERVSYLKRFGGHSQSFSTLQPDMQYFDVPDVGYMAYRRKWGATIVLSDPVCAPENFGPRSEEHTSELQSRPHLVCRLLLEKKNYIFTVLA